MAIFAHSSRQLGDGMTNDGQPLVCILSVTALDRSIRTYSLLKVALLSLDFLKYYLRIYNIISRIYNIYIIDVNNA